MKTIDNQPIWDAKRLVQEYMKEASSIYRYKGKLFKNIPWSNQIRIKRIASVLRAFFGLKGQEKKPIAFITSVFDGWKFSRILEYSSLSEEDHASLHILLKDAIADGRRYESLMRMQDSRRNMDSSPERVEREKILDRHLMLHVLFEYRIAAQKLVTLFDGVMEGTVGAYLAILAVKGACINPLKCSNEKIDDIIVILLGNQFKQSFSEEELKLNYGYPKETDQELNEWDLDNW